MRIQKYKIIKGKYLTSLEIYCDYKNKKIDSVECSSCEYFISVNPKKEEIKCSSK